MATDTVPAVPSRWELAAETIAVKIRWFGLLVGYVLVNFDDVEPGAAGILNAILTLGAAYALLDTWYSLRGRVFLGRYPLRISPDGGAVHRPAVLLPHGAGKPFPLLLFPVAHLLRHPPSLAGDLCHLGPALRQLRPCFISPCPRGSTSR